jgi:hypothetical protein
MHGMVTPMPRHPRLAPWPIVPTQTSQDSDTPELNLRPPRLNRLAIDSNTYT